ncbi:hypothetical protein [Streptomyces sp. TLI_185]|uniref:hypothetical protein n=1 Tax=Streptomyces sp. TLI_185 TaxID=2485151 RepID=UPI000F507B51|nr:hypothetical protein [Streptomyces sp. TLI_185]
MDVDVSDDGPKLDQEWTEADNNVCGIVRGCRDASCVAERFVRAGWRARSSSWDAYEVEASWCNVEIEPAEGSDVLIEQWAVLRRLISRHIRAVWEEACPELARTITTAD